MICHTHTDQRIKPSLILQFCPNLFPQCQRPIQCRYLHSNPTDIEGNYLNVRLTGKEDFFSCLGSPVSISCVNDLQGSKGWATCRTANIFHHFLTIVWKYINLPCKSDFKLVTTRVCMCRLSETAHTCVHERKQQSHSVWLRHEGELKGYDDKKELEKGRDGWMGANKCQTCEKISTAMNKHEHLCPRWSVLFTTLEYKHISRCTQSLLISAWLFFFRCCLDLCVSSCLTGTHIFSISKANITYHHFSVRIQPFWLDTHVVMP